MPITFELYRRNQQLLLEQLDLKEHWPQLVLMKTGFFRGSIMRIIERTQSPSRHIKYLPHASKFRGFIHQGDFKSARNAIRDQQATLLSSGLIPKELHIGYLSCPDCNTQRGGDQVLLLRRYEESVRLKKRIQSRS